MRIRSKRLWRLALFCLPPPSSDSSCSSIVLIQSSHHYFSPSLHLCPFLYHILPFLLFLTFFLAIQGKKNIFFLFCRWDAGKCLFFFLWEMFVYLYKSYMADCEIVVLWQIRKDLSLNNEIFYFCSFCFLVVSYPWQFFVCLCHFIRHRILYSLLFCRAFSCHYPTVCLC